MNENQIHEIIKDMPKVELHLHLEGAFTFEFLLSLIEKYGGDPSVKTIDDLKNKFVFTDFAHFIELWYWKNRFFRRPVDFEESAYHTLKNLSEQNVIYSEVFFSPWDFASDNLSVEEITEATIAGVKKAEADFPIKCGLIADIVRDYGSENAVDRVKQMIPFRDSGVIGIGLGGSEQKYPPQAFAAAFQYAGKHGFHLTAHAGEAAGPESVRSAMDDLAAERIGHGVRAIEDPALIEDLKQKRIPLEICVNSNLKTKVYPSPTSHPVKKLYDRGLVVTINSDDPAMFGCTITDEFLLLYDKIGFRLPSFKKLTENAIRSSFLPKSTKLLYLERIHGYWENNYR
ncbi:MAG: adenosine deaminase [Calditrichaceae bacterium]